MASQVGRGEHYRQLMQGDPAALRDAELLACFTAGEDAAFAALAQRHGPMVFGLCKRLLQSTHDAEDAWQATFLVLARRAAAIRQPDSLAGWLYGVAFRVARKMKAQSNKRREVERRAAPAAPVEPADASWLELQGVLDEELQRLPDKQRQPLLLCCLQGLSQEEAAAQLGWPRGTLKRRLELGRELLKKRLTRRGLALAAGMIALLPAGAALAVAQPAALTQALLRAAKPFATGQPLPPGLIAGNAVAVAEAVLRGMLAAKITFAAAVALLLGLALVGGVWWFHSGQTPETGATDQQPARPVQPLPLLPKVVPDIERLQGNWRFAQVHFNGQPGQVPKDWRVVIRGDQLSWEGAGGALATKLALRPDKNPKELDITKDGQVNDSSLIGIYKIDGNDSFTMALILARNGPRPTSFAVVPGQPALLYQLERVAPADKKAPPEGGK